MGMWRAGFPRLGYLSDQHLFEWLDTAIYSFHMPLFFFVSGVLFLTSFARQG